MPIEIKELVIKANAQETTGTGTAPLTAGNMQGTPADAGNEAQHQIIEECVRQVLAILERKNER